MREGTQAGEGSSWLVEAGFEPGSSRFHNPSVFSPVTAPRLLFGDPVLVFALPAPRLCGRASAPSPWIPILALRLGVSETL